MNALQLQLPPELQREVHWKNADEEKLMLASSLISFEFVLSDNEVSISFLVFFFCSRMTVWCRILHSLLLFGRILNARVQKKILCLRSSHSPVCHEK